ncbi:MFS transporter [Streptomyces iconiensis]|uniref:MFS transporter n=1 Tax=Streptomyces iconiensis TaxID=1384038 RepID=A0ABT6ZN61_9ACTN|nr:MFS transporter [Streptomyces iconiensis]MDJ1130495.1 MFS transporter [Streptomyces iconiensis]
MSNHTAPPTAVAPRPPVSDSAPAPGPAPSPRPSPPSPESALRPLGLFVLLLGAALPMIDFFVVNVAFPDISRELRASPAALEMVVASYAIAYAALLVLGGRLGDSYGRRRLFLWGAAAFGITSLACGLAPGVWWLILARLAQGAASALMFPQVLATIHATTTGERRSRAIGLFGSVGGISMVLGQVLGGVLVSADVAGTGWRAVFLVNVPVVALALLLGVRLVPDSRSPAPARGDIGGTVLLAAALSALLLPLTEGRSAGWPWWSVLSLAAAPLLGWAFYALERHHERAGRSPLLPPSLLRERGVRQGLTVGLPIFLGFSSWMFVMSLVLQEGLRLGPLAAGLALVPMGVAQFGASLLAPRVATRLGSRTLALSAAVHATGLVTLALTVLASWPGLSPAWLAPGMVLCGLGQGLQLPVFFRVVLGSVPHERAGAGSGLASTAQQSCLALGVATLGSLFLALVPSVGMRDALLTALAVQTAGLGVLAVLAFRLPKVLR